MKPPSLFLVGAVKPKKAWGIIDRKTGVIEDCMFERPRPGEVITSIFRVVRVLITELPPERKRRTKT